ncbi:hypothetical protein PsorP6_018890 [Peronosclerospora sorghi]|nr:hypothetical protein PsorP6_018890 [Peronosclerospora sorghi]
MDYVSSRPKCCTVMDDDVDKLHQPLILTVSDEESENEELNSLLQREAIWNQFDEGAVARRKRKRRKEDDDLGEVIKDITMSAAPLQLLHYAGKWMTQFSSTTSFLVPFFNQRSPTSLSTHLRANRRNLENMDDVSERALAVLAIITLGFCCLLLFVVYVQEA